jgi:hypothetical protein
MEVAVKEIPTDTSSNAEPQALLEREIQHRWASAVRQSRGMSRPRYDMWLLQPSPEAVPHHLDIAVPTLCVDIANCVSFLIAIRDTRF